MYCLTHGDNIKVPKIFEIPYGSQEKDNLTLTIDEVLTIIVNDLKHEFFFIIYHLPT